MTSPRFPRPVFAALLLAAGALSAQAPGPGQPPPPPPDAPQGEPGGGGMMALSPEALSERLHEPAVVQELGLTPAQLEKIDKLAYDTERAKIDNESEGRLILLDMRTLFGGDTFDAAKAQALVDRHAKHQEKIARARMNALIEFRKIFTSEQWRKLREHARNNMREKMQQRRGMEGGPGGMQRPRRPGGRRMSQNDGPPPPPEGGEGPEGGPEGF